MKLFLKFIFVSAVQVICFPFMLAICIVGTPIIGLIEAFERFKQEEQIKQRWTKEKESTHEDF